MTNSGHGHEQKRLEGLVVQLRVRLELSDLLGKHDIVGRQGGEDLSLMTNVTAVLDDGFAQNTINVFCELVQVVLNQYVFALFLLDDGEKLF